MNEDIPKDLLSHNEILIKLGRYPIEEKLSITQQHSIEIMKFEENALEEVSQKKGIFPWELEVFMLFAINSNNNHTPNTFNSKQGKKEFSKIINSIRQGLDPEFDTGGDSNIFLNIVALIGNQQFSFQEYAWGIKIYRYNFIFNHINIKDAFTKKFLCSYSDIAAFSF